MIDLSAAKQILDFSTRLGPGQRADEQLEGSVALHNFLVKHGVAYLADEVGMGKTYVALGVMALFRHFQPDFRVLVIAPRGNIQRKWLKELNNFVHHNVRYPDLRIKGLDGHPARGVVLCENLLHLAREVSLGANRDFFMRLPSFSLGMRDDAESKQRLRDELQRELPWLKNELFDLRKEDFKDNYAKALCCLLPPFDLVIVDEGHNLKHGFGTHTSARNRVLGLVMGHPSQVPDPRHFPSYGPRARKVLFLSATPIEDDYRQIWNQLDVFGKGAAFRKLADAKLEEEERKEILRSFLIRRVTSIRVDGAELTKNLYRREWRAGGVKEHDEPIRVTDPRQRLVVALVQKKVTELLARARAVQPVFPDRDAGLLRKLPRDREAQDH